MRIARLLLTAVIVVLTAPGLASAKGGASWDIDDGDGYLLVGQHAVVTAMVPAYENVPTQAWLIRGWEWDPLPDRKIFLSTLEPTSYRVYGERFEGLQLTFTAPSRAGKYSIVSCSEPCHEVGTDPYPRAFTVVQNRLEARLRRELAERDHRIYELDNAIARARERDRLLDDRLTDHLRYLGHHAREIDDLEQLVRRRSAAPSRGDHSWALTASAGLAAGMLSTGLLHHRRRRRD